MSNILRITLEKHEELIEKSFMQFLEEILRSKKSQEIASVIGQVFKSRPNLLEPTTIDALVETLVTKRERWAGYRCLW